VDGNLTKSGGAVIAETTVFFAEVAERKAVQVELMSRIAEGTVIRVVGRFDTNAPSGANQAMELLHGADDVGKVLNDVDRPQQIE